MNEQHSSLIALIVSLCYEKCSYFVKHKQFNGFFNRKAKDQLQDEEDQEVNEEKEECPDLLDHQG